MSQNKSQFGIIEASVILSSVSDEDKVVDVRSNIVELNFYENLYKTYIDASIVLIDDFGMKNALKVQGTERLRIVIGDANKPNEPVIVKYFFFSKITDTKRMNERSEVIALDLVEEQVYIDAVKQISRAYNDTLENVMTDIASNELGKGTLQYKFDGSAQGERKVVIPYLSPIQAINWVRDRATTRTGSPIFFYSTLYSNDLILQDLDTMLREPIFNDKLPLRYSTAIASVDDKQEQLRPYYEIITYTENNTDNALAMYENGAIGSFYETIDASTGSVYGTHISIRDIVDEFYTNDLISPDTLQTIYDPSLEIDGKLADEYNSMHVHQVVSNNTYNQYLSYHDEARLLDDNNNTFESRLKIKNKIIRTILKKNVIDIAMQGSLFFEGQVSVGNRLRVLFLNSDVTGDTKDASKQIDTRKSGDYLILAISHKLMDNRHSVSLRLTKLGELPKDFKL